MIYEFAKLKIKIEAPYKDFDIFAKDYISKDDNYDLLIEVNKEDVQKELDLSEEKTFSNEYLQTCAVLRKLSSIFPKYNRLLMHGAVIEYEGNGYMFSADSGTGKTTHILLWRKFLGDKVKIVNGDKPFLINQKDHIEVCGSPWCGKENYQRNVIVPLKGICFIERGKENKIRKLTTLEAMHRMFKQIYFPKDSEAFSLAMDVLSGILEKVDIYLLQCDISNEAVKTSFEMMTKGVMHEN